MTHQSATLAAASSLTEQSILALVNGELDVIRVPNFFSVELCALFCERLIKSQLLAKHEGKTLADRVGQSFFFGYESEEIRQQYWANAQRLQREIRETCAPYLTPIDKLRLELDDVWPAGATLASLEGHKMFAGVVRFIGEGRSSEPHQDTMPWHMKQSTSAQAFVGQLSANTYLQLPPKGGALQLWRLALSEQECAKLENKGSYGLDTSGLPKHDFEIFPETGELIIINTRRLHGVGECIGGTRISWSNFIGYAGADKPLSFWS